MTDLHWTVPVVRWATAPATLSPSTGLDYIDPMLRRRLSNLSRMALVAAVACLRDPAPGDEASTMSGEGAPELPRQQTLHPAVSSTAGAPTGVRMVFASRHGELRRSTDILRAISAGQPVSPTAFSLSVMNAMTGVFSIARHDRSASSAMSAGPETLGYALLEGYAQYVSDPTSPVLVVYADETADPIFGAIQDEVEGGAVAVLISRNGQGYLTCGMVCDGAVPQSATCATQSAALRQVLTHGGAATWRGAAGYWTWSWADA
ncbi:hypothetical protein JOE11_004439 [Robbsia andropogonis]|uniref:beta-ketoacyl synthase chain length factor n=1 Tax=Robbsia andropogonis TaxID=28092 RepID=UPI0020A1F723|nr:beta-ketoacyl synthase chain length factor [Robbsia andropogonis]MCP1120463.1 beta-ketoacyl synthase chain length factor [Robbsia andropogonis]MCP1130335.1 beta-ketoacyl synthase chain length factor [Robbsia andropogonis]